MHGEYEDDAMRDDLTSADAVARIGRTGVINAAAHELTRRDPSPHLRAAVRARIEQRRSWWTVPVRVPALAGAVVVVVAVYIAVSRPIPLPPAIDHPRAASSTQPMPAPPIGAERSGRPERLQRPERRPASVRRPRIEAPEPVQGREDPLIDPLVIEPLPELALIAIDPSSGVMPIQIEPLQIEPLQPQ